MTHVDTCPACSCQSGECLFPQYAPCGRPQCTEQVAQRYVAAVGPFLKSCPRTAALLPPSDAATRAMYLWATAIIASYSFTIGDDK